MAGAIEYYPPLRGCYRVAFVERIQVGIMTHASLFSGYGSRKSNFGRATSKEQVSAEHAMHSLETVIADDFRSESNKHGVVDGVPEGLDECSLKAYGNAIVPQVALQIFETINEYERLCE